MAENDEIKEAKKRSRDIVKLLISERQRQVGLKNYTPEHDRQHSPLAWIAILDHEMGCASDCALSGNRDGFRRALEKIGAVCIAALDAEFRRAAQASASDADGRCTRKDLAEAVVDVENHGVPDTPARWQRKFGWGYRRAAAALDRVCNIYGETWEGMEGNGK